MTPGTSNDVQAAKEKFCQQFTHADCGGHPIAWVSQQIRCSNCEYQQPCAGDETLGDSLSNTVWVRNSVVTVKYEQDSMF